MKEKTKEQYEAEIALLNQMVLEHNADYMKSEFHLRDLFFIPENLGFEPIDLKDDSGFTIGVMYVKGGYVISKDREGFWVIKSSSGDFNNRLFISNMMEGVLALRMSGMDISGLGDMVVQSEMIEEINTMIDNEFPEDQNTLDNE